MSYLSVGEKHGIQGGENARGEKVSGGRKCVSHLRSPQILGLKGIMIAFTTFCKTLRADRFGSVQFDT